jgi:hypothetical protein
MIKITEINNYLMPALKRYKYHIHLDPNMRPLWKILDKDDHVIFLTKVVYDYYSKFYKNVKLFDPSMLKLPKSKTGVLVHKVQLDKVNKSFDYDYRKSRLEALLNGLDWVKNG